MKKIIFSVFVSVLMVIMMVPQAVILPKAEVIDSGICGDGVTYTIDSSGVMKISGSGSMYDYEPYNNEPQPWEDKRTSIKTVKIGPGIKELGYYVFSGFSSCEEFIVDEDNQYLSSEQGVLYSADKSILFEYPDGRKNSTFVITDNHLSIVPEAFDGCRFLKEIILPEDAICIGPGSFSGCGSLVKIRIPDSVTYIDDSAFAGCTSLSDIVIPENSAFYGSLIFDGCSSLKNINVPCRTTDIAGKCFRGCSSLSYVTISDGVKDIFESAFEGCVLLTDVYYSGSEEQWNSINIYKNNEPLLNADIHFNSTGPARIAGDVNSDGKITSEDARFILRNSVRLETFSDDEKKVADVNNDGSITSADARIVLRRSVGLA